MPNIICWICRDEKAMKEYDETDLLSDEGEKPCLQCYLEAEADKEESEEL